MLRLEESVLETVKSKYKC